MPAATFRFYAELNDFLAPERGGREFTYSFIDRTTVKDMIESFGVPHTEVDVILVNGESVAFTYIVEDGDRVSVYPMFEALDVKPLLRVRPEPLRVTRFVADVHLGKLAGFLRMLGFDTVYANDLDDAELARISSEDHRILLTRDRGLLKRSMVTHGYCLRQTDPRAQTAEIVDRFDLKRAIDPFRRCMKCNGELHPVAKNEILHLIPADTATHYEEFRRCAACAQLYWKGSHYRHMQSLIEELTGGPVA
jgi:uncharacterized protein